MLVIAALLAAVLAVLAVSLVACGATDAPPTSPFDDRGPDPTLPPGVATGTPPPLGTPAPTATPLDPDAPVTGTPGPMLDDELAAALAIEVVAEWLAMPPSALTVAEVTQEQWIDSCMDVYRPAVACAEVITHGMRVELQTILRASVHVVHIASPGDIVWVPDRVVEAAEVIAVDPVTSTIEVRTDDGTETWRVVPGSTLEPSVSALTPGMPVAAGLDGVYEDDEPGEAIVWLSSPAAP